MRDYDDYDDYCDYDDYADGGCGEGFSCDECGNLGCPANPMN